MGTPLALPLHLQISKTRTVIRNAKVGNSIAKLVNTMPICPRIAKRLVNIAVNHFFLDLGDIVLSSKIILFRWHWPFKLQKQGQ